MTTTKPRRGPPIKPEAERLRATIPAARCLPETRAQYEELGGPEWLRRTIHEAWKKMKGL